MIQRILFDANSWPCLNSNFSSFQDSEGITASLHVSKRSYEKKLIVKSRSILRKPVYTVKWRFPKIGLPLVSIQFHGMFRRKKRKMLLGYLKNILIYETPKYHSSTIIVRPVEGHNPNGSKKGTALSSRKISSHSSSQATQKKMTWLRME